MMGDNPTILLAIFSNMISIGFFNFFGIKVTKVLSASHRVVADSLRSVFIWMVSLLFGWEAFIPLQIIGFVVLSFGAFTFGEAITLRSCFPSIYPSIPDALPEAEQPLLNSNSEPATPTPGVKISMVGWAPTSESSNRSKHQDL